MSISRFILGLAEKQCGIIVSHRNFDQYKKDDEDFKRIIENKYVWETPTIT